MSERTEVFYETKVMPRRAEWVEQGIFISLQMIGKVVIYEFRFLLKRYIVKDGFLFFTKKMCAARIRRAAVRGEGRAPKRHSMKGRTRKVTPQFFASSRHCRIFSSPMTSTTENQVFMPFSAHFFAKSCKPAKAASPKAGLHSFT